MTTAQLCCGQQSLAGRAFTRAPLILTGQRLSLGGLQPRQGLANQPRRQACSGILQCAASAAAAAASPLPQDGGYVSDDSKGVLMDLMARVRALCFYLMTFAFATPLLFMMTVAYPFVMLKDKYRRQFMQIMNNWWAKLSTLFFYRIEYEGLENMPKPDEPAVYVANHLSFLDIYTLFHLNHDFKFISKASNFLIPIIGWSMYLTGHVSINRVDRKSQLECLKQCGELLKKGASVLFFPEGTRSKDGRLYEFKKGAFSVASKAGVPVVPITLIGTGDLMPNTREYLLYPGTVRLVVHKPIPPQKNADAMMEQALQAVASSLPPQLLSPEVAKELAAARAESAALAHSIEAAAASVVDTPAPTHAEA